MKIVQYQYDWEYGDSGIIGDSNNGTSTVTIDFEIDSSDHKTKKHIRMTTIGHTTVEELD